MVVIPESNYKTLIDKAETMQKNNACLNASNLNQLNHVNVGQGGKVTVQYNDKGQPIKTGDASHVTDCKPTFDLPEPPSVSESIVEPTMAQEEPIISQGTTLLDWGEMLDLPSSPISIVGDEAGDALSSQRARLRRLMGNELEPSGIIGEVDIAPSIEKKLQPSGVIQTDISPRKYVDVSTSTIQPTFIDAATGTVQPTYADVGTSMLTPTHVEVGTSTDIMKGVKRPFNLEATDILPPSSKRATPLVSQRKRIFRKKSVKTLPAGYVAPEYVPLPEQRTVEEQDQIDIPETATTAYYPPLQKKMMSKMSKLKRLKPVSPYDISARPSAEELQKLRTVPGLAGLPTLPIKLATIDAAGPIIEELEEDLNMPNWQEPEDLMLRDEDIFSENFQRKKPLAIEFKPNKKTIITPPASPGATTSGLKQKERILPDWMMQNAQLPLDEDDRPLSELREEIRQKKIKKERILPDWMMQSAKKWKKNKGKQPIKRLVKNVAKIDKKLTIKKNAKITAKPVWVDPSKLLQEQKGTKRKSKSIVLRHVKQRKHDEENDQ